MSEEIIKALLATVATLIVGAMTLAGVILSSRKPSTTKPPKSTNLQEFNGTQNQFMALVIADNADLRKRMEEQREISTNQEIKLNEVALALDGIKVHQNNFLAAVRRYLMKLASAWVGPDPMPWPDDVDFHILEETLPKNSVKLESNKENG